MYNVLRDAVANMSEGCVLTGASEYDLNYVYVAVMNDHPQFFWMSHSYVYGTFGTGMAIFFQYNADGMKVDYTCTRAQAAARITAMNTEITKIFAAMPAALSEYDRELYFHDYLLDKNSYEFAAVASPESHLDAFSAYGALITGRIVCEGYSRGWQLLLYHSGINASLVVGHTNPDSQPHMWNMMKIDGKWYFSDLTWDDGAEMPYMYFNLRENDVASDHIHASAYGAFEFVSSFNFKLPNCNSLDANYYVVNGWWFGYDNQPQHETMTFTLIQQAALEGKRKIYIVMQDLDFYYNLKSYLKDSLDYDKLNEPITGYKISFSGLSIIEHDYGHPVRLEIKW